MSEENKGLLSRLNIFNYIFKDKSLEEKEKISGWLMLLPVFPAFIFVIYLPALKAIIDSFTDAGIAAMAAGVGSDFFDLVNFVGLENYVDLFTDSTFWAVTLRSFILVLLAVGLQYILGLILALLLNEELKGMGWFKNVMMLPWVVPVASMVVMFSWMTASNYGLLNMILRNIGLENLTRNWFGSTTFAFPMVIIMHVWRNMPFYAMTLYAALKSIPQTLYEAARIDGANAWQRFTQITLPNIKYPSMIVIVLHVLWTFNNFDLIYISTGGGPVGRTEVLATKIYDLAWHTNDMGRAAALGVLMMVVMMIFSATYLKLLRSDS